MIVVDFNDKNDKKIVLALGYFDCLHIGHRKLLEKAQEMAREKGALGAVFTFSNNPGQLLKKKNKLVNTFEERLALFENMGMDAVFYAEFTKEFMSLTAQEFLQLLKQKNIVGIVCGFDYTFGKNSVGTVEMLKQFCDDNGIDFAKVDMVGFGGEKASATLIKEFLIDGEMEKANECLGHYYFMTGEVCHGYGVGKTQVFPTANIMIPRDKLYPKTGVYSGLTLVGGKMYPSVINVGGRPTFDDPQEKIEVYIIGFDKDIYQDTITVCFKKYLREIKKFKSAQQLKEQICRDIEAAKCVK